MTVPGDKGKARQRNERLKAALRENLRRRKAQERGRDTARPSGGAGSENDAGEENPSR